MALWLTSTLVAVVAPPVFAADVSAAEFKARRTELMARLPDGIVLLHARGDIASQDAWYQHAWHQDPSFYYFAGDDVSVSSILAIDGMSKEVWLFTPPKKFGNAFPPMDAIMAAAAKHSADHTAAWAEFVPWVERRLASNPIPVLYVDDTDSWWSLRLYGRAITDSNPPGLDPIEDTKLLWRRSLERRWPRATLKSASPVIQEMRLVKSPAEIELMRAAGRASVSAWFRGAHAVASGESPR
jgi:Xaa-Pro aminopeptidase